MLCIYVRHIPRLKYIPKGLKIEIDALLSVFHSNSLRYLINDMDNDSQYKIFFGSLILGIICQKNIFFLNSFGLCHVRFKQCGWKFCNLLYTRIISSVLELSHLGQVKLNQNKIFSDILQRSAYCVLGLECLSLTVKWVCVEF